MILPYSMLMLGWVFWLAGLSTDIHALYIPAIVLFTLGPAIAVIQYMRDAQEAGK